MFVGRSSLSSTSKMNSGSNKTWRGLAREILTTSDLTRFAVSQFTFTEKAAETPR